MLYRTLFLLSFLLVTFGEKSGTTIFAQTLAVDFGGSEPGEISVELLADRTVQITHLGVTFQVAAGPGAQGGEGEKPRDPSIPRGRFGLSQAAHTAAVAVNDQRKKGNRVKLGAMFVVVADLIRNGKFENATFTDVAKITEQLKPKVLGGTNAWEIWAQDMGEELAQLQSENKIEDLDDLQVAYREIQRGLIDPTTIDPDHWQLATERVRSFLREE